MERLRRRIRLAALILLPSVVQLVGIGQSVARPGALLPDDLLMKAALGSAILAPIVAAIVLARVSPGFDIVLFATTALLASVGAVSLYLLGSEASTDREFYEAVSTRHGLFVGGGFIALLAGAVLARHVDRLRRYPYTLALAAIVLTAATAVLGQAVNGARLWLQIGPLRFQPSEVAKLFLAAFVSMYLFDRRHLISDRWRIGRIELPPAPYLIPVAGGALAAVAVLIVQNDLGMATLIALSVFVTVAAAMQSRVGTTAAIIVLVVTAAGGYAVVPRLRDRVLGWLDPWSAPTGIGFQFIQSDFVLAASGVIGNSTSNSAPRVPEVHTDFILVAIDNRFGVLAVAAVLALNAVLVLRCVMNALRAEGGPGAYFALSLAVLFGIQTVLIVGGVLRVLPLTGLTLPLVSYGGTSMLMTFFAVGLILQIGSRKQAVRAGHS